MIDVYKILFWIIFAIVFTILTIFVVSSLYFVFKTKEPTIVPSFAKEFSS